MRNRFDVPNLPYTGADLSEVEPPGGWPNDVRSLGRRLVDVLAGNLLIIAICLVTMFVLTKLFA